MGNTREAGVSTIKVLSGVLAFCSLAAACGTVAIYDHPTSRSYRHNVGLEVYPPRPYIMVTRTKAKDKPLEVSVVYLPDTSRPRFVHLQPGLIGSSKLNVSVNNGMVTSIGAESTSGVSELLTAYGGLATSLATAAMTERETDLLGLSEEQASDTSVQVMALQGITTDLADVLAGQPSILATNETRLVEQLRRRLTAATVSLDASAANAAAVKRELEAINQEWDALPRLHADMTDAEKRVYRRLDALRAQLQNVINGLGPAAPAAPDFTLFEIVMAQEGGDTVTSLREVSSAAVRSAAAVATRQNGSP
jgi:hypothetical protein